ncbi:MAG TPA: hypothetical protein ENH82_11850 [bacterium]|nr:hypothetical protein [bacterium]
MQSSNKISIEILVKSIESLVKDVENPLRKLGISEQIIQYISSLLNKYSHCRSQFYFEVIANILQYTLNQQSGLLHIERFLETSAPLEITSYPDELPFILSRLFSTSAALSNLLNSDTTLVNYLAALKNPLQPHLDKNYYLNSIIVSIDDSGPVSERIKAVHRMHTVQLIRICARNANPGTCIAEITAELSSLAEAVIEYCLNITADEISVNFDQKPESHSLFVLGLGKLGGMELNVSSDIDIIYLFDNKDDNNSFDTMRFHLSLAERLTNILSEATELGYLYRVDTRLRADGASGPLVRSIDDYFRYLEMRGEAWERQMLLKARPVAGDIKAGRAFLDLLKRFIFPASITRSPNREIVALKNQIEARITAEGSKKTHLKLMPGGIRDIEFITQCLQLLMGGIHPEVCSTNTLSALSILKDVNALSAEEYSTLSEAYILYRRIENALQWRELLPAFTLPDSPEEMKELSSYLYIQELPEKLDRIKEEVRIIYDEIFTIEKSESFEEMAVRSVMSQAGDEKVKRFLENLGFNQPSKSMKDLSMLVFGKSAGTTDLTLHPSIERFLPKLLKALSALPDPGGTLERFKLIADSYNAHSVLFDIMERNPGFFELLIKITHGSVFITDILVKDPSLLDWLVEAGEILYPINQKSISKELKCIDSEQDDDISFTRECVRIKLREKLRIGTRDITGISIPWQTFSELAIVAECIVKAVYKRAFREIASKTPLLSHNYAFGIIAAGKIGSEMMDFGSDLDLIFIYKSASEDKENIDIPKHSITIAQQILSLISGFGVNKIYDVDARLRPEGGNSPLAVSIEEYKRYFERRASVWERLALVRAKYLAGSDELKDEATSVLHHFVYNKSFTSAEVIEIMNMRKKIAQNSLKRYPGMINIKSGYGGITDIDFIAQSYAAHYGAGKPQLRLCNTINILNALCAESLLNRHDVSTLIELFTFLCNVEKAIRTGSGKSVNTLPKSGIELARVCRLMGFKNVRRFNKQLQDVTSLTKELYDRLMQELLDSAVYVKRQKRSPR